MWIEKCRVLFQVAARKYVGRSQDLAQVEEELEQGRHEWKVGRRELEIIESSDAWGYPDWWPRLSSQIETPILLPEDIHSAKGRRTAVESLHKAIKNIEIVSVVLRFMCPDGFGIMSPPVTSFLCLFPSPNEVQQYLYYLRVLDEFRRHYASEALKRVADIDMALWAAAHLSYDPQYAPIGDEIRKDEHVQETRISNLANGLGLFWHRTSLQRIVLARTMLPYDYGLAGLIAARIFESVVLDLGRRVGIRDENSMTINIALVKKLELQPVVDKLRLKSGELTKLWGWRNDAVHANANFDEQTAKLFVNRVEALWRDWQMLNRQVNGSLK